MRDKIAIIFLILVASVCYGLTLRGAPGNPTATAIQKNLENPSQAFELSPERGRYAQILTLAEHHTYALTPDLADAASPDVGYSQGKFYSFFAPGIPYLALPFYIFGSRYDLGQITVFGFVSVLSILSLLFLYKISRNILNLPIWASLFAVIIFAFGSTSWSYAITLYQHLITVFFIFSSFYAVWKYRQGYRFSWLWALYVWVCYGLAIFIDYPNALLMLPVIVYLLYSSVSVLKQTDAYKVSVRSAFVYTFAAFLAIGALHAYHNQHYFGSWKRLSNSLISTSDVQTGQGQAQATTPEEIAKFQEQKTVAGFFREQNIPLSFYILTASRDRGLLRYCPILLLAIFGIWQLRHRLSLEHKVLLALVAVNLLLYGSWGDPWGGWAYGPRYLIPAMAALALLVAVWVSEGSRALYKKVIAFLLFSYSAAVALLGALTTNAVPPGAEAGVLHTPADFLRNWQFFKAGQSGSFAYHAYFSHHISLNEYFLLMYIPLLIIALFILFIFSRSRYEH